MKVKADFFWVCAGAVAFYSENPSKGWSTSDGQIAEGIGQSVEP